MKAMHRILAASLLAAALTACGTGVRAPQHFYELGPQGAPLAVPDPEPSPTATAPALLVTPTTAAGFYDAPSIAYSLAPGTRAYYQLNSWTEPPGHRLGALLAQRLRRSGAFATVATVTGGGRGTLVLDTQLEEIYHDLASRPGAARISLTATLSDPAHRSVAAQRRFTASAPAPTPDAAGAVQAFDRALGPLLDEVVAWAAEEAARSNAAPGGPG
jgi:cholesterol transport system auxiliary component